MHLQLLDSFQLILFWWQWQSGNKCIKLHKKIISIPLWEKNKVESNQESASNCIKGPLFLWGKEQSWKQSTIATGEVQLCFFRWTKHTRAQQRNVSGKQEYHVWIILLPAEIVSNDAFFPLISSARWSWKWRTSDKQCTEARNTDWQVEPQFQWQRHGFVSSTPRKQNQAKV